MRNKTAPTGYVVRLRNRILLPWKYLPIVFLFLQVQTRSYAQGYSLNEPITLRIKNSNITEVLEKIDAQTNFSFSFSKSAFKNLPVDRVDYVRYPLHKALEELKLLYGVDYQVVNTAVSFHLLQSKNVRARDTLVPKKITAVTGKVVDFENGDPLAGATVSVEGRSSFTMSDTKGVYEIKKAPAGKFVLLVSYAGYQIARIQNLKVEGDDPLVVDVKLQVKLAPNTVVVTAIKRKRVANTTDEQLVKEVFGSKTIVSGISNEQISRTLDRDAAEVVKRIPGVNISEDNFVIVRGLGKRYNLTFLNDAIAPATDADSRSFSYDMINSNAIDRILVYKSPSPDLPGEFSGGVVKIFTKKSQLTRQVDLQFSAQYRYNSSFENVWSYSGGRYDFLGIDDGTRKLPAGIPRAASFNHLTTAENARYSKQFKNIYVLDKNYKALPDLRFNANYYNAWKIGKKYLKNLTTISYTSTHEQRSTEQNALYKHHDGKITQGIHAARISAIQSNEIKLNDALTVELRHFFNVNNQRVAVEDYRLLEDYPEAEFRHTNLYYVDNLLYSGQLGAGYLFGKDKRNTLKGNLSYSFIHKQEPDNRDYTLTRQVEKPGGKERPEEENPWFLSQEIISFYTLSRVYNDVREKSYQANLDLDYRISGVFGFKTGYYHESRYRDFSNRTFIAVNGENLYDPNLAINGSKYSSDNGEVSGNNQIREKYLQHYFDPVMFREDGTGYRWLEKTTPNNQYVADNVLNAGYLSADLNLLHNTLNIFGGARVEDNRFRILGSYENGLAAYPLVIDRPVTSVLPSVNVSFRPDSSFILRAGYGKTLNRPEFREAAPMQYTNYIDQETYNGNPALTTVNIHNMELRLEYYPNSAHRNEMMNIGFFYKQLDHPIERFRMIFSEGFDQYFYVNTGKAKVYGIEAEFRKGFDFLPGRFFRNLSTVLNGSWFHSNVDVPSMPQYVGYAGTRSRPMQGQSPYLLNASLNYEDAGAGTKVSFTYNRAADYIYAVGGNKGQRLDADIMVRARNQLDITWRQRLNKIFSINAGVQNLLNAPVLFYQDWKNNYKYDKLTGKIPPQGQVFDEADVVFRKYYQRPYFSLAVNMIF